MLDLSCRKRDGRYYVVTDRWQRFSELVVDERTLDYLGACPPYAFEISCWHCCFADLLPCWFARLPSTQRLSKTE